MAEASGTVLDGARHRPGRACGARVISRSPRPFAGALVLIAAALSLAVSAVTMAQESPPQRTAQLSYLAGSVSLEPAGTQNWIAAELNRPVTVGDKIWADRDSRAELDIGDVSIRLWSMTGFSFLNLDQLTAQMQVTAGAVIVHVWGLADGEQDEIDTPNLALSLEQPGTYRVEVSESGDTTIVKVVSGEAVASGGGQTFNVGPQQSVTFMGIHTLTADYATLGAPDAFDDWSMARDRQEESAAAAVDQYVSPEVVGSQDLAAYGSWQYTPQWGYAWFPVVPMGWAPYSLGQWVWISPWGWTWVDDEPWGFAPFHYGRWGWWSGRWCWVPGPRTVRPVYAPALVAFTRGRIGAAGTRRSIGWLPLGPRDVYVPSYAASRAYVRDVNVTNTRHIDPAVINSVFKGHFRPVKYANSAVAGAVTAVPRSVFATAQPVAPHRVGVPRPDLTRARFTSAAPAITPVRASVLGQGSGRAVAPPRRLIDRPVVARIAPPRAPVSFAAQQTAIRANGGRPLTLAQWAHLRPNQPAVPVRLAGAEGGALRGRTGLAGPAQRPSYASERPGVPSNRPPWAYAPSRNSAASVPAPRRQPGASQPGVLRDRPPWVPGGSGSRRIPPPARSARTPDYSVPPRNASPPRFTPPPRMASPPPVERPPRFESQPHFAPPPRFESAPPRAAPSVPSYHPSPAPAPRALPPEIRRPPLARASSASPHAAVIEWAAPPMYRAQPSPNDASASDVPPAYAGGAYAPPETPPPMYRPVGGGAFEGEAPRESFAPRPAPSPLASPRAPHFAARAVRLPPRAVFHR